MKLMVEQYEGIDSQGREYKLAIRHFLINDRLHIGGDTVKAEVARGVIWDYANSPGFIIRADWITMTEYEFNDMITRERLRG